MTPTQKRGQAILAAYIALIVGLSALMISLYASARGIEHLPSRAPRFALLCVLCIYLYRGGVAAKQISIVLFSIGGAFAMLLFLDAGDLMMRAMTGAMALFYLSFVVVLLASSSVSEFLAYQRAASLKPLITTQPVGDVFNWPKNTILTALDRLTLALPAAMIGPNEVMSTVVNCDDDAEITIPLDEDKIYIRLNAGMKVSLRKSAQAIILPWTDGEAEPKRIEITASPEFSV
jgi:hypothetical protein